MPMFQGTLINSQKKYDNAIPIDEVVIRLFSTDIDSAELALMKLNRTFPELTINEVYECPFTGSDPTATDSDNKRS